tara:strand:+ start:1220 stop:1321 length:102 start_codon:yes stop_codon:yes gene_type:complete
MIDELIGTELENEEPANEGCNVERNIVGADHRE